MKKPTPTERAKLLAKKRRASKATKGNSLREFLFPSLIGIVTVWIAIGYKYSQAQHFPLKDISATRIKLSDGRFVAYHEIGASRNEAKFQILVLHDYKGCRLSMLPDVDEDLLSEHKIRLVSYDRPGYGQSDPFSNRTVKSEAMDIAEIADKLNLGLKFHVLAYGMGGYAAWSAMRFIPERLAGVAMLSPVNNYWWPDLNTEERSAWKWLYKRDRISLLLPRYLPTLLNLWMTQPLISVGNFGGPETEPKAHENDAEILARDDLTYFLTQHLEEALRQGSAESWQRDLRVLASDWSFDLTEISNEFQGPVYIWHGNDDWVSPRPLFDYAKRVLPWLEYENIENSARFFYLHKVWSRRVIHRLLSLQ